MLHTTYIELEYQLDISRATNGSHIEVYETQGKKSQFSLFVAVCFIYRFVFVQKL